MFPQRSLSWYRLMQSRPTSTISLISVYMFHVTLLWMVPNLNLVFTSSLPSTCYTPRPSPSSWYCHPVNISCYVLCSLVISCIWCHSSWICGVKDSVCRQDTDDIPTDIESWYWIIMILNWEKNCGLYVQIRRLQLQYLLLIACVR